MTKKKQVKTTKKTNISKAKQLVIVESPAKARTINKYLGSEYVVMASVGHVRDLPDRNPKGIKDPVPGVDIENNFQPTYQIIKGKKATVTDLKKAADKSSGIWLATDLDREGEAIAWHLTEALEIEPENVKRVVFNAITKDEITKAFQHPRPVDMNKVNAQQARRILDRIVGYQVSPLLWRKVAGGLSAGRVQSVAVRLIVEREREIEAFIPQEYWKAIGYFTIDLAQSKTLAKQWPEWLKQVIAKIEGKKSNGRTVNEKNAWLADHQSLAAELIEVHGLKFEPKNLEAILSALNEIGFAVDERQDSTQTKETGKILNITQIKGHLEKESKWKVKSIETRRTKSRPSAPFITSTLQQTAANQLDFTAQTTMRVAQNLYEGLPIADLGSIGLITYMRTDSTHVSPEAIKAAREYIQAEFGNSYLPAKPNFYASSNKDAQEAHEAIRPTDVTLTPKRVHASLNSQQYKLYKLIWERFVASQMTEAEWDSTTVLIEGENQAKDFVFKTIGRTLVFDGFYKVTGVPHNGEEAVLPQLAEKQPLALFYLDPIQNYTLPPPRYNEASLVKKLEAEGIGRPSTYAAIIQVIQNRRYVEKINNRFYASDLGRVVTDKLIDGFPEIMEVGYTRDMEQQLDNIEEKDADWVQMLKRFYKPFKKSLDQAYKDMDHAKSETQEAPYTCPQCGSPMVYRFGRNGRFLSCSKYPECKYAAPIDRNGVMTVPEVTDIACPKCGEPMLRRRGRFGPFLSCQKYPACDGIMNFDKKGNIIPPQVPPLKTDLACPKCQTPLNLRRGAKGPWLSCSKFPKCRGRMAWSTLDEEVKKKWEKELKKHEKANPKVIVRKLDGTIINEQSQTASAKIEDDKAEQS
jgi:DNA topoisomerase-1